jgi:hypothetical protein
LILLEGYYPAMAASYRYAAASRRCGCPFCLLLRERKAMCPREASHDSEAFKYGVLDAARAEGCSMDCAEAQFYRRIYFLQLLDQLCNCRSTLRMQEAILAANSPPTHPHACAGLQNSKSTSRARRELSQSFFLKRQEELRADAHKQCEHLVATLLRAEHLLPPNLAVTFKAAVADGQGSDAAGAGGQSSDAAVAGGQGSDATIAGGQGPDAAGAGGQVQ